MDLSVVSIILGIIASLLSLVAIGYKTCSVVYEKARMEWFRCGRAKYIMNKFCGATSDADNARIVRSCAANIHCFNVYNLTRLWNCMVFYWTSLSAHEAVEQLLSSLESRSIDVVISICRYYEGRSYNANSFAVLLRFLYGTFATLTGPQAREIRNTFDVIFHSELLHRPSNVVSLLDLAWFASLLLATHTYNQYAIVDYMRDLLFIEHFTVYKHPIYRKALKNIHLLALQVQDDEQKFYVVGSLYIVFGNLNIMPSNDLQLSQDAISRLKIIDANINGVPFGEQSAWFHKASLVAA